MTKNRPRRTPRKVPPQQPTIVPLEPTPEANDNGEPPSITVRSASVTITLPMVRITGPGAPLNLPTRHMDVMLRTSELRALCDLCDGLRLSGVKTPRGTYRDAFRWLLVRMSEAFAAAEKTTEHPDTRKPDKL